MLSSRFRWHPKNTMQMILLCRLRAYFALVFTKKLPQFSHYSRATFPDTKHHVETARY